MERCKNYLCDILQYTGDVFDCGTLDDPENGNVDLSDGTTEGSDATYTCFPGYELKGTDIRTCSRSGWSDQKPTCERKLTYYFKAFRKISRNTSLSSFLSSQSLNQPDYL